MIEMWAPWTNFPARNDSLGIRIGCPPCILSKHWYNPSSFTFTLSCFWFILNVSVSLYCSWTFLKMSFLCFNSSLAVSGSFNLCFLKLLRKQPIQLNTPNVLRSENFDNSLSKMFSVADVVAKTFYNLFLFSFWLFRPLCLILKTFRTFPPFIIKAYIFHNLCSKSRQDFLLHEHISIR